MGELLLSRGIHNSRFCLEREISYAGTEFLEEMNTSEAFNRVVDKAFNCGFC